MGKLSQRDAGIIARQLVVSFNQTLAATEGAAKRASVIKAFGSVEWQNVLRYLGRRGPLEETEKDWHLSQVFEEFRKKHFPERKPEVEIKALRERDAVRLVEYYSLKGFEGEALESEVLKAWHNEQR